MQNSNGVSGGKSDSFELFNSNIRLVERRHIEDEIIQLFFALTDSEQKSVLMRISPAEDCSNLGDVDKKSTDCLSNREKQVLVLLTRGYTRRKIGDSLGISLNTASRHIANIYQKLDISTIAEAVRWAMAAKLVA